MNMQRQRIDEMEKARRAEEMIKNELHGICVGLQNEVFLSLEQSILIRSFRMHDYVFHSRFLSLKYCIHHEICNVTLKYTNMHFD